ncbi:hypothetical protein GCM10029964_118130 [Kibdelosporangium lantanae]
MTQPLNLVEQGELLDEIATVLVGAAPAGWQRLVFQFTVVDRKVSVALGARMTDGDTVNLTTPRTVSEPISKLRKGMRVEGTSIWTTFEMLLDPPSRYQVRFR